MKQLKTPQRAAFDTWREKQRKRTQGRVNSLDDLAKKKPGKTPLGLDPVDPFDLPVDLTKGAAFDGTIEPPTAAQKLEAEANFMKMVPNRGEDPFAERSPGFGDGIDALLDDEDDIQPLPAKFDPRLQRAARLAALDPDDGIAL